MENDYFLYVDGNTRSAKPTGNQCGFIGDTLVERRFRERRRSNRGLIPSIWLVIYGTSGEKPFGSGKHPIRWLKVKMPDGSIGELSPCGARAALPVRCILAPGLIRCERRMAWRFTHGRASKPELLDLAKQTLNLAMKAPGREGAFKCFAVPDASDDQVFWGAGDGAGRVSQAVISPST